MWALVALVSVREGEGGRCLLSVDLLSFLSFRYPVPFPFHCRRLLHYPPPILDFPGRG